MPLFFLGTREWRNRQTRTVQVRVPVMEWGFNSPLAHNETADPSGSAVLFSLVVAAVSLVAPRVFRAPEGSAAVCAGGRRPAREPSALRASLGASSRSPARPRHRPSISHVIPLRLVQTLNLYRRNCNVFGVSRKMTAINYVRNVGGGGVVAAHGCRSQVLPLLVGVTGAWCAWFLGCFGACCYKRRQSRVFFVWISAPLLQTSSIQRLFR